MGHFPPSLNKRALRVKQSFTIVVLTLFTYSFLAVPYAEAGMWEERREAVSKMNKETLLAQLPTVGANLPGGAVWDGVASVNSVSSLPNAVSDLTAAAIQSLPLAYANFKSARFPKNWKPADGLVIQIQDVHMNAEAQANIGKTIQGISEQGKTDLVALEGAFKDVDVSGFRRYEDQDAVKMAADYFLKEGKLSGAIYAALTAAKVLPAIVGVDDKELHTGHISAYRESVKKAAELKKQLAREQAELEKAKQAAFSKDLLEFDRKVEEYRNHNLKIGDYVKLLTQEAEATPQVDTFLKALAIEKGLDFGKVEQERSALIQKLVTHLSKEQISQVLNASLAYRLGKVRHTDFYIYLQGLCKKEGVPLKNYPSMDGYIRYVVLSDSIRAEKFLEEVHGMEQAGYKKLARTAQEKGLIERSRVQYLTGKLADFALTPEEWKEYKESARGNSFVIPAKAGIYDLSSFESFFNHAEMRDKAMSEKLIKKISERKAKQVVLVTGGYHSGGMGDILDKEGLAVVTLAPKITKLEGKSGTEYLSVFTQEKTPLEKLFDGDKLFVVEAVFEPAKQTLEAGTAVAIHAIKTGVADNGRVMLSGVVNAPDILPEVTDKNQGIIKVKVAGGILFPVHLEISPDGTIKRVENVGEQKVTGIAAKASSFIKKVPTIFEDTRIMSRIAALATAAGVFLISVTSVFAEQILTRQPVKIPLIPINPIDIIIGLSMIALSHYLIFKSTMKTIPEFILTYPEIAVMSKTDRENISHAIFEFNKRPLIAWYILAIFGDASVLVGVYSIIMMGKEDLFGLSGFLALMLWIFGNMLNAFASGKMKVIASAALTQMLSFPGKLRLSALRIKKGSPNPPADGERGGATRTTAAGLSDEQAELKTLKSEVTAALEPLQATDQYENILQDQRKVFEHVIDQLNETADNAGLLDFVKQKIKSLDYYNGKEDRLPEGEPEIYKSVSAKLKALKDEAAARLDAERKTPPALKIIIDDSLKNYEASIVKSVQSADLFPSYVIDIAETTDVGILPDGGIHISLSRGALEMSRPAAAGEVPPVVEELQIILERAGPLLQWPDQPLPVRNEDAEAYITERLASLDLDRLESAQSRLLAHIAGFVPESSRFSTSRIPSSMPMNGKYIPTSKFFGPWGPSEWAGSYRLAIDMANEAAGVNAWSLLIVAGRPVLVLDVKDQSKLGADHDAIASTHHVSRFYDTSLIVVSREKIDSQTKFNHDVNIMNINDDPIRGFNLLKSLDMDQSVWMLGFMVMKEEILHSHDFVKMKEYQGSESSHKEASELVNSVFLNRDSGFLDTLAATIIKNYEEGKIRPEDLRAVVMEAHAAAMHILQAPSPKYQQFALMKFLSLFGTDDNHPNVVAAELVYSVFYGMIGYYLNEEDALEKIDPQSLWNLVRAKPIMPPEPVAGPATPPAGERGGAKDVVAPEGRPGTAISITPDENSSRIQPMTAEEIIGHSNGMFLREYSQVTLKGLKLRPLQAGQSSLHIGTGRSLLPIAEALMGLHVTAYELDADRTDIKYIRDFLEQNGIDKEIRRRGGSLHYIRRDFFKEPPAEKFDHISAIAFFQDFIAIKKNEDLRKEIIAYGAEYADSNFSLALATVYDMLISKIVELKSPGGTILFGVQASFHRWAQDRLKKGLEGRRFQFKKPSLVGLDAIDSYEPLSLYELESDKADLPPADGSFGKPEIIGGVLMVLSLGLISPALANEVAAAVQSPYLPAVLVRVAFLATLAFGGEYGAIELFNRARKVDWRGLLGSDKDEVSPQAFEVALGMARAIQSRSRIDAARALETNLGQPEGALDAIDGSQAREVISRFRTLSDEDINEAMPAAYKALGMTMSQNEVKEAVSGVFEAGLEHDDFDTALDGADLKPNSFVVIRVNRPDQVPSALEEARSVLEKFSGAQVAFAPSTLAIAHAIKAHGSYDKVKMAVEAHGKLSDLPTVLPLEKIGMFGSRVLLMPEGSMDEMMTALAENPALAGYLENFGLMWLDHVMRATRLYQINEFQEMFKLREIIARSA